jgi:hypothetical protein
MPANILPADVPALLSFLQRKDAALALTVPAAAVRLLPAAEFRREVHQ